MKKFLLFAVAAIIAVSANAQTLSSAAKKSAAKKVEVSAVQKKFSAAPAKNAKLSRDMNLFSKRASLSQAQLSSLVPAQSVAKTATPAKKYDATGNDLQKGPVTWEMQTGTFNDGSLAIVDVIPNPFGFENGVAVEYTLQGGNTIVIEPQLVASSSAQSMYVYILDAMDDNINLTLAADGSITGTYEILYGVFTQPDPNDMNYYDGYYSYVKSIKYALPGAGPVAPEVSFEPENLVLFAGLGVSGYSYNDNLAMTGAYAPFTLHNNTLDAATAWSWSAMENGENAIKGTTRDFTFNTVGGNVYTDLTLVGDNKGAKSDPYAYGYGNTLDEDTKEARYEAFHLYAGSTHDYFEFSDGTLATMTRLNPDGDLTFYLNWATPDKASNSMSKIYVYQGKPNAPLYMTGVTLPMVAFTNNGDFNLHMKVVKCERTAAGRVTLGDVIAEGDASMETVDDSYAASSGLTNVYFNLYTTDEDGMTTEVDHIFVEDEFMIIIEGWDNGSFSGVLGCEDIYDSNTITSTWFEMSGEEGSMYSYTTWKIRLFVGIEGAAFGYLHTTDNTNITLAAEGGQATLHVEPMICSVDTEGKPSTRLFVDDNSEIPEWITLSFDNEVYNEEEAYQFDLVITAEALPAGIEGREADILLFQEGAKLNLHVTQGNPTGISTVATKATVAASSNSFNIAGQQVSKDFKGIVVREGKKFLQK